MTTDTAKEIQNVKPEVERVSLKPFSSRRKLKENYKRKIQEARLDATIDPMTGLPNFGAFETRIAEEADRLRRTGQAEGTTTVIYLDADKLKLINDTQGHAVGDKYIKSIAEALRNGTRRDLDFAARTGGDEFALILPGTDLKGAETMWADSLNPEFLRLGIAISGGAAELDPNNIEETKKRADDAMYGAKRDESRNGENLLYSFVRNGVKNG